MTWIITQKGAAVHLDRAQKIERGHIYTHGVGVNAVFGERWVAEVGWTADREEIAVVKPDRVNDAIIRIAGLADDREGRLFSADDLLSAFLAKKEGDTEEE